MRRNLDLTALRAFVMVAEAGGVTRAAGLLNLTQSAVSMQLKRLEESLNLALFDRSGRTIALTASGEQLLSYARRMVTLNDEAVSRMTSQDYVGEVTLGVPHDIVTSYIPEVLKRFNAAYPRMRVTFLTQNTMQLLESFSKGEIDLIVTTEEGCGPDGETLAELPLVWIGAPGSVAWKKQPLPLAFETDCIFRAGAQRRLDAAGIPWEMAVDSSSSRTIEVTVGADLAIHAQLLGTWVPTLHAIDHGGVLPDLKTYAINMYQSPTANGEADMALAGLLREVYGQITRRALSQPPSRLTAVG